jgi:hypothetical protein
MSEKLSFSHSPNLLDPIMYPVALQPIVGISQQFFQESFTNISKRHNAIVNLENNEIISVVSPNYKLLPNKSAIAIGKSAFVSLFPSVRPDSLVPFKVITPASKASCHIDLIHQDVKLSATQWKQDNWYPFLRISNSYNRTLAFSLEIGFVRELCSNGIIFSKETVKIKFSHDKLQIKDIDQNYHKLKILEHQFSSSLNTLNSISFDKSFAFQMACKALNLKFNTESTNERVRISELRRLENSKHSISQLTNKYFTELGNNAYAMLNILSDFVSHQHKYKCIPGYSINPNAYYRKIDAWSSNFISAVKSPDFSIEKFLLS